MYPKIKKISQNRYVKASEHNKLVESVNKLLGLEVGKGLRIQRRAKSVFIDNRKSDVLVYWAKVIRGLQHEDDDDSDNPNGFAKYVLRLVGDTYFDEAYAGGTTYSKGQKCLYSEGIVTNPDVDFLYKALQETTGNTPEINDTTFYPGDNSYWQSIDIIPKGLAATTSNYDLSVRTENEELRQFVRWFKIDDVLPLIKKDGDWYIFQTLMPVGDIPDCSITWLEDEDRVAAVYKG